MCVCVRVNFSVQHCVETQRPDGQLTGRSLCSIEGYHKMAPRDQQQ